MTTTTRTRLALLSLLGLLVGPGAQPAAQADQVRSHSEANGILVDCDAGHRLERAVRRARPGSRIVVRGTCYEQIKITKHGIRIHGRDNAVIDGGSIEPRYEGTLTITGARDVVISNVTVRNGPDQGIVVQKNASVVLRHVQTTGNATTGVTVDASYAELSDVSASDNGAGFDFFTGSTVIALGDLTAVGNRGSGLAINGNSSLELRGSVVETTNNGGDGITLVNDADLLILSFPESQGSGVRAANNAGAAGIFVANSSISVVGSQFFGSGANVFDISGHGVGMLLISSNLASPFGTAKFNIAMNGVGMVFTDDSEVIINGGLNVQSNFGPGIVADGAGVIRLQPNPLNPSVVQGNPAGDLLASFGSRLAVEAGVEIGNVRCDPTVLAVPNVCN